ncbi:MAG: hypothetical protein ACYS0E_02045 [Planctomycetota bacterium]
MRAFALLLVVVSCGEPIQPEEPKKTLPFTPRPGTAEVGEATVVVIEARIGETVARREYTDEIAEVRDGRAVRVTRQNASRGSLPLVWEQGRFVDEQGTPHLSFELFEQLLPRRDGDDVPTAWTREGVLGALHELCGDLWDRQGGTADCEFEEILVQKAKSEAWVGVRYRDNKRELTGRLTFDLNERMLTHVELRGDGLKVIASRRITTVK